MKFMILDGNSIINRAFYGVRPLSAPDGTPTNAVFGFINILQRLIDTAKPDSLAVAFDLKGPTFRHLRYDGYKAQRKGMPEELAAQMPILKELLDTLGIRRFECQGYEADDIMGTAGRICEELGWQCDIVTGDKDSFQLISDNSHVIHIKSRMGQTETNEYTPEVFREEYGFDPVYIVDLKALMGDSSDNIPGVPGIGEKTALNLIRSFGSLEGVYENIQSSEIKEGMRKKLIAGEESAKLSYELATIVKDVPLEIRPEDCRWNGFGGEGLYALLMRLGFRKFIERWNVQPEQMQAEQQEVFSGTVTSVELKCMADVDEAMNILGAHECYIWTEPDLDSVAIHVSVGDDAIGYWLKEDSFEGDFGSAICTVFGDSTKKIGHHIKDIQRELLKFGVEPANWVFDTALAAYLLDATASNYDLDVLCTRYCGFELHVHGMEEGQMSLLSDSVDQMKTALENAAAIACLHEVFEGKLRELAMEQLYYDIELPLCGVLAQMESVGVMIDRDALMAYGNGLADGIEVLQSDIFAMAGESFNINSPKQLGVILFEKLMLPTGKKTKTGWSTNAEVLEKLRGKHPIVQKILDYRTLTKLKSTYADGLLKVISADGRIHSNFTMTVTATGRLSSVEPNLQNIPVRKEQGSAIRRMFVAAPGNVLVDADYSQIELRLLAHIAEDETMREAFRNGEDIHTVTASQVFGVEREEVTASMRSQAKAVNFGIVYGMSAFSLAQDIGVFQNEAQAYINAYFDKYNGVREYMSRVIEEGKENGYVSTIYGRRRYMPELKVSNFNVRSSGERMARNMPIQGTAADIMKLAMVCVHNRLRSEGLQAKIILQVHDELIVECAESEAERVCEILTHEMERVAELAVPLTVDAHIGRNWMEAKG